MADGVPIETVIQVLRFHHVTAIKTDQATEQYMIERGDFLEEIALGTIVHPRHLQRFKRRLKIPIDHFWHPERASSPQT